MLKQFHLWMTIASAVSLVSCAKVVVVPVPTTPEAQPIRAEGVFYALPKTVLRIQMNMDHDRYERGKYPTYANVFAPDQTPACKTDCADENKKAYSVEQGATITSFGEPDAANVYMVKFVGRGALDQNIALAWTETGLISTASASVTNRTTDVVISGLKLAAGVASKTAFGSTSPITSATKCPRNPSSNDTWVLEVLTGTEVPSDASSVLVNSYCALENAERDSSDFDKNKKQVFSDTLSAYVFKIWPLVATRAKLLTATQGVFEPTELLTRIESQIDPLMKKYFLGSKSTTTWAATVDVRLPAGGAPGTPGGGDLSVLRIDPAKGLCLGEAGVQLSPDGKPMPDGFVLLNGAECSAASPVSLATMLWPMQQMFQFVQTGTTAPGGDLSFRYRIPAQVKAELKQSGKSLGTAVVSVAQFGNVRALPANRHSKTLSYDLAMVEATGGLKSFKIGTTGSVDSGTVDSLASVAGTLLDARNASNKADQTAQDPTTKLTKQDTLLKTQDDICTILKKYGLTCSNPPQ